MSWRGKWCLFGGVNEEDKLGDSQEQVETPALAPALWLYPREIHPISLAGSCDCERLFVVLHSRKGAHFHHLASTSPR